MSLDICRICGSSEHLKHVFREGSEELLDQIRLCTNIQIHENDCLPKYVCDTCEQGLAFSYRLRKRGEETEKKLRQELLVTSVNELDTSVIESESNEGFVLALEEEMIDEQWVQDENDAILVEGAEQFANEMDGSTEYILNPASDQYNDETEQWVSVQEDVLSDNIEIVQDVQMEYTEQDVTDLVYDGTEEGNDPSQNDVEEVVYKRVQEEQIECKTCGELFDSRSKYSVHIKTHGDLRYHCVICDKWFNVRYRFEQHMKNHSSQNGAYPCSKCSKSYTNQSNLERHIRSAHEGEKRFQCTVCGASFGRADILKMHMTKHSDERNVECEICQKKFKTSQHLHFHKKSHVEKSERPVKPVRLKPMTKPKSRTQRLILLCEYCDKISHHRTTHANHMRTHTGEKPYKCDSCEKSFRTSHARRSHMLVHTDERPFKCKVCTMSFRQTAHLKSHMLIHTGIKKHVCDFCQKAFTMKNNLVVHMRMHTGDMPHKTNKKYRNATEGNGIVMSQVDEECDMEDICGESLNEMERDFEDGEPS